MDRDNIENLVQFSQMLLLQFNELLKSDIVINETKEFIVNNMIILDGMNKTAINFQGNEEQKKVFTTLFDETLNDNYRFVKNLLGYQD